VLEDARPPRFAALLSVAVLALATVFVLLGAEGIAWILTLVVAVAAAVSATTGICVGCEAYAILDRRRHS
jgi:NADH:ubiquinone oxidoreductase subunit 6 (subunit J)